MKEVKNNYTFKDVWNSRLIYSCEPVQEKDITPEQYRNACGIARYLDKETGRSYRVFFVLNQESRIV